MKRTFVQLKKSRITNKEEEKITPAVIKAVIGMIRKDEVRHKKGYLKSQAP